ncbi:GntR family transcriptional regulator [Streptomyces sp. NPDC056105]|uniref:GntR family transcriptional regulator n=1 Tax=Streptomyces sp. NPDC056105 TaxID=3345714 RepID=UPI0035E161ED
MTKRVQPAASMADQVYTVLHESIMSGEYPAGYRLRIRDLAAEVGTSEMPVREAIRRLEEAGFAERVPHKGAVVKGLEPAELLHVYGVRTILEVEAARLGTARADEKCVDRMRTELDLMGRAMTDGAVTDYLDHDEKLLATLYEASGNPVLLTTIRGLWQQCRAYKTVGARSTLEQPDAGVLLHYQQLLVDAAAAGDFDASASITHDSLTNATERIKAQLPTAR